MNYIFLSLSILITVQTYSKNSDEPKLTEIFERSSSNFCFTTQGTEVIFESKDGLPISGHLYSIDDQSPVILLCHQAGYNKHEYADIAPRLNALGYNCLAIDQRSGGSFADEENSTFENAKAKGLSTEYVDAEQDMVAALEYLEKRYNQKVILWGSSYSSALSLHIGNNKNVKAIISFSPGDYFGEQKENLSEVIPALDKPFFITSSKAESVRLKEIIGDMKLSNSQVHFIPKNDGFHGSKALWVGQDGADEYWDALKQFLEAVK
ncbi:MAG: alpha/beta hydrolase [Ekhidna sp.]